MSSLRGCVVALLGCAVGSSSPCSAQRVDVNSLVEAERAFARDAQTRTVTDAFLAALAEDGILFRPGPVPGRAWTRENPFPADFLLDWEPEFAALSASADLGWTTGPYSAGRRGAEPGGFGRFVSVWKHTAEGWRVATDIGISHAPPRPVVAAMQTRTLQPGERPAQAADAADDALNARLVRDRAAALRDVLDTGARVLRNGHAPAHGEAALALATRDPAATSWRRTGGDSSAAGDMAYSYGEWVAGDLRGTYLRIWHNEAGRWRLALDLAIPGG